MNEYNVELGLYEDCLFDIQKRVEVIADHLNHVISEKYLIVEVETVCLQFRKVLEDIALMSLVANKEIYAEQNAKFAKHYHAKRIMNDLEKINPEFYPVPIKIIEYKDKMPEVVDIEEGYLTKEEFIKIYEKCGSMMHAQNPFSTLKPIKETWECFPEWLTKICILLNHHRISLVGGDISLNAYLKSDNNGLPQAVLFEREKEKTYYWVARVFSGDEIIKSKYFGSESSRDEFVLENSEWKADGKIYH